MANSSKTNEYNVVLTGQLLDGADRNRAATSLAKFLNTSPKRAVALLQGKSKVIKKGAGKEQALKYKALLSSHGIGVKVTPATAGQEGGQASLRAKPKESTGKRTPKAKAAEESKVTYISEAAKRRGAKPAARGAAKSVAGASGAGGSGVSNSVVSNRAVDSNIFSGLLQCKRVSMLQQLSLVASCSALVVCAAIYAAIFVSVAFFALERLFSFFFFNDASTVFSAIFFYFVPALIASFICALMLRPVLAKPMRSERLELSAKNERNLINFVKQIASMVGAPKPEEVILTDEFAVDAEFKAGWKPLKEGRIQLRVGLPLLMVLDIPALAGAVAAALARFDDSTGMYMLKVIRELNQRLENSYHNRDNWQDAMDRISESDKAFYANFLARVYQPVLTLSAWIAFPFLLLVRLLSAATSRTYCMRSDDYFSGLAGTRKFVEHFTQLCKSRYAYAEAEESLRAGVESQKFVNDLPALLLHHYKNLAPSVLTEIEDVVVEHSTTWNDLRPCNRDRMIAAEEEDYEGIVALKAEAWRLLQDLKDTSRRYTLAYYKMHDYGVDEKALVDAREIATSNNEERMRDEICRQYYNGWFEAGLFWQTNQFAYARSISKQQRIVEINECIKILRRTSPDFMTLKNEVPEYFRKYSFSRFALEIHKAGYRLDEDIPHIEGVTAHNVSKYNDVLRSEYETRRAQQRDLCRVMGERLCFALAFLEDQRERKIAEVVMGILSILEAQANQLDALRHSVLLVPYFRERIKKKSEKEHGRRLARLSREILGAYEMCMSEFERYRWPFGSQYNTFADYIGRNLPRVNPAADKEKQSLAQVLDSRIALYEALWKSITQANRFLNGKIAPLAQKAEQENNIARIKMAVSGKQAG